MRIQSILESVSAGGMGTGSIATAPSAGKTMIRRQQKETIDPADQGEYDREGDMARDQLYTAAEAAAELRSILDSNENLPEWVQSKITKAMDYLDTARDYMKSKDIDENKKGVRAVKHTVKPRNFVAKNAVQSGAGAHKDKKKAQKQGDVKHKGKEPAYESVLWEKLEKRIVK